MASPVHRAHGRAVGTEVWPSRSGAAPMRMAPEALNKRLGSVKFLNASDFGVFEDLRLEVEGLRQPDEALPIIRPNEPEAWQKLFKIYRALKQRSERQVAAD